MDRQTDRQMGLLLGASSVSDHLYKACAVIARGHLPYSISSLLSASRLIAIPKKNGDVRPIAVGEVFRQITAKVICNQLKSNFADHLSLLQHGVAVEGGSEMLVHHVQLALESNPSWALLKTDMSNAFNKCWSSCLPNGRRNSPHQLRRRSSPRRPVRSSSFFPHNTSCLEAVTTTAQQSSSISISR